MTKTLAATLLMFVGGVANASGRLDRPILSCDKAPLLSVFQRQLPDHILATTADKQPKILSPLPMKVAGSLHRRAMTSLVCVAVALDATGKPETAEVSYPVGIKLNPQERQQILETEWSPAERKGQVRPSFVSMTFEYETR
jgi:hypothetical protein